MSLIDLASLVLAPTAVKDGKVYNAIPNDQDFTFSRGTEATRVNSAGLIEKARTNFLRQSNTFDTTWGKINLSVTINAITAPDGSLTASKIVENTINSQHRLDQGTTSSSGVNTFSVYLKQGERTTAWLRIGANGCFVDLTDGSLSSVASNIIASSTELANDWYRVSITKTNASANETVRINIQTGDYEGDGTSGIYVWSAQYEQGLVSTDVITTTTSSVTVGITDDLPRVDYSGGGCPSLLLEGSRTNLLAHSEYLNGWNTIQAITIEANTDETLSPEGKYNAYKATAVGGGTQRIYDVVSVAAGSITMSMYVKAGTEDQIRLLTTATTFDITYDLTNETKTEDVGTGTIEAVGNGWYRISATGTSSGGTEVPQVRHLGNSGSSEYQYWYGIQIEQGSYVSSYIPTYGTSTSRSADSCNLTNASNLIGQSEGTAYIQVKDFSYNPQSVLLKLKSSSLVLLSIQTRTTNQIRFEGTGFDYFYTPTQKNLKIAVRYSSSELVIYINGIKEYEDTSITVNAADAIYLNEGGTGFEFLNETILFPTALTDTQLQELTK